MGWYSRSLMLKMFLPAGMLLLVLGIIFYVLMSKSLQDNAIKTAIPQAVSTVNQYKTIRAYYTNNVVQKVLAGSAMKPHYNHKLNANQIPLPATFIHDISEELSKQDMTLRLYSAYPFPNRANRQLDDFAKNAWEQLNSNPKETFNQVESINGQLYVRVAIADTMAAEGCVNCHNSHPETPKADWKLGDVRGVLEVQVPISEALAAGKALQQELVVFLLITVGLSAVVLFILFKRNVVLRLDSVTTALNEIAKGDGDLSQRLNPGSADSVGMIAFAFNGFVEQLENALNSVSANMHQLVSTAQSLANIAEQSKNGIATQENETEQVAEATKQMNAASQEVAKVANETSVKADKVQEDAQTGSTLVADNMATIETLATTMTEAVDVVSKLNVDSQNIGGVLEVIRGIADQTNLLALNAAIEAARAGEQGRGFAVVADEVRTLASRTQASTEEIQVMIEQLQNGAKTAVTTIERSNQSVNSSLDKSRQVDEMINVIVSATQEIMDLNAQVAAAVEQQHGVSEEINNNVVNIGNVAADNTRQTEELQASINSMKTTIELVNEQLNRFTGKH